MAMARRRSYCSYIPAYAPGPHGWPPACGARGIALDARAGVGTEARVETYGIMRNRLRTVRFHTRGTTSTYHQHAHTPTPMCYALGFPAAVPPPPLLPPPSNRVRPSGNCRGTRRHRLTGHTTAMATPSTIALGTSP